MRNLSDKDARKSEYTTHGLHGNELKGGHGSAEVIPDEDGYVPPVTKQDELQEDLSKTEGEVLSRPKTRSFHPEKT